MEDKMASIHGAVAAEPHVPEKQKKSIFDTISKHQTYNLKERREGDCVNSVWDNDRDTSTSPTAKQELLQRSDSHLHASALGDKR